MQNMVCADQIFNKRRGVGMFNNLICTLKMTVDVCQHLLLFILLKNSWIEQF